MGSKSTEALVMVLSVLDHAEEVGVGSSVSLENF